VIANKLMLGMLSLQLLSMQDQNAWLSILN